MLPHAIELSLGVYLLVAAGILLGGFGAGIILAFTLWLENKWFLASTVAGGALAATIIALCFKLAG